MFLWKFCIELKLVIFPYLYLALILCGLEFILRGVYTVYNVYIYNIYYSCWCQCRLMQIWGPWPNSKCGGPRKNLISCGAYSILKTKHCIIVSSRVFVCRFCNFCFYWASFTIAEYANRLNNIWRGLWDWMETMESDPDKEFLGKNQIEGTIESNYKN